MLAHAQQRAAQLRPDILLAQLRCTAGGKQVGQRGGPKSASVRRVASRARLPVQHAHSPRSPPPEPPHLREAVLADGAQVHPQPHPARL